MSKNLTSMPTLVESPFIIVQIGDVTFGSYSGKIRNTGLGSKVTYPNFMDSMTIVKVNGTVNTYTINFTYQVRAGEDPNLLDKIFGSAANTRKIILKYGDWNAPEYIYKEEKAIITNVRSQLDMQSASIKYTVSCTSDAIGLASVPFNFPSREAKPSDVIVELLSSAKSGLPEVFSGMRNVQDVISNGLIASNDKKVSLLSQNNTTPLQYLGYLVGCMQDDSQQNSSTYALTVHDEYTGDNQGTYFSVTEIKKDAKSVNSTDTFEIDINYPGDNFVTGFSLNDDQSWAILYEYNDTIKQEEYSYTIDDDTGKIVTKYAPSIVKSNATLEASAYKTAWWNKMTSFPIKASLTIKGLTRPSMLMTYVKLNVIFNGGMRHISSGLYIITKQTDTISKSGYKTTFELLRIGADE